MAEQAATVGASHNPAHWLLRIALASVFIFHGVSKVMGLLEGAPIPMGQSLEIWAAVAFAEAAGGVGILVGGILPGRLGGIITRLSGLAIIPVMIGAIAMVHWPNWNFTKNGMEFQVVLLLIALYFFVRGNDA